MSTRKKRAFEADASVAIAAMMARRLTGHRVDVGVGGTAWGMGANTHSRPTDRERHIVRYVRRRPLSERRCRQRPSSRHDDGAQRLGISRPSARHR